MPTPKLDMEPIERQFEAIADEAAAIGDTDIELSIDGAASTLDGVTDKLAAIAEIFQTISSTFTDFLRVPVPAVVSGAYAPPRTRYDDSTGGGPGIRQLLERFLDRAAELEEKMDSRPIRVESHVEIDKREIARATAEVRQDTNNISNGGGRW